MDSVSMQQGFDPDREEEYWRNNYRDRPYARGASYDEFGSAYAYGISSYDVNRGQAFDEIEGGLRNGWDDARDTSRLTWEHAKHAVRDVWDRLTRTFEPDRSKSSPVRDSGVRLRTFIVRTRARR
jgi:hypothetical protein